MQKLLTHISKLESRVINSPAGVTAPRGNTYRKDLQVLLQTASDRNDIVAQVTSDAIWDWDIVNNQIVYTDGILQMFGYQRSEVDTTTGWWKMNIHLHDFPAVVTTLEENLKLRNNKVQFEYRFRCADGCFKYIYDRAIVIYNEDKSPIRMIGAMQDISNSKEKEKQSVKAIIDAQKNERYHIGQELHGNINQILLRAMLHLNMAKENHVDIERIFERIAISKKHIAHAFNEIRKLSHDLTLISFEESSLKKTFEGLLTVINLNNRFHIDFLFDKIDNTPICNDIQVNLYRIFQEQIKNIITYSEASSIEISVTLDNNTVRMRIFDNGKGFNNNEVIKGTGLANIRKRAESFSGKYMLNTSTGNGCELIVEIPFQNGM